MNRIKELREEKKLTQSELAEKLNITQSTIHNYESGKRDVGLDMCRKIVSVLSMKGRKVTIDDVFPVNKKATNGN